MHRFNTLFSAAILALIVSISFSAPRQEKPPHSVAYQCLDIALEATAREHDRNGPRPTIGSRMLAIIVTAMFDAWAAYDDKAVGTRLGESYRRPPEERTRQNKEIAIRIAMFRSLLYLFPEDSNWILDQMRRQGLNPENTSLRPDSPEGVGNATAAALITYRRRDGANQHGDEVGGTMIPYSDYTYYRPVNPPNTIVDPDCWQPIEFEDGKGGKVTPGFLTPHWYRVSTFALTRADQFRPGPPPKIDSMKLRKEVDEVLAYNANLSPEQKAIVEFMRDGPRSTGQSGHWLRFAQDISRRDKYGLDEDVLVFCAVGNVAMDAFIAAWDSKRIYDSSRPWTLVRHYYKGKEITGWAGPGKGVRKMPAEEWHPYSPMTFITPPFPGYVSGHSTVSGACARILTLFTGSDRFGETEKRKAGLLTEPGFECAIIQMRDGKPIHDKALTCDVALRLPTFSATAEMAGISRVMGGYHIQADNIAGLKLGRDVADFVWPKMKAYFNRSAMRP